jgi:hypothetical protein
MTTETIEKSRIPGVPDKALVKAANLATTNVRISWGLDEDGKKVTQAYFGDSGIDFIAENNTLLVSKLFDVIASLQSRLEDTAA